MILFVARIMSEIICEVCGISVEKADHERHLLLSHEYKVDLKCNFCNRSFASKSP